MFKHVIIGTRASRLALKQAYIAKAILKSKFPNCRFVIRSVFAKADIYKDRPLKKFSSVGIFVKELERLLIDGKIDIAVHSAKDLGTVLPSVLTIAAVLKREKPFDVLVSRKNKSLKQLPFKSIVGTGSLRRAAQLKSIRPDLIIRQIRGNVETRIKKLKNGNIDAVILAYAGLKRLRMLKYITQVLDFLPCAGQAAIALQMRKNDKRVKEIAKQVNHEDSFREVISEKAFLGKLHGGCNVPIAVLAKARGKEIFIKAVVFSRNGKLCIRDSLKGRKEFFVRVGLALARRMIKKGAAKLLVR
ncbi:MAG: hydroxymethylbilane synthase [Candidatus Gygaella obscura]|nr:hydroxymethylbilane synthase [Candidatus Gygaella obscura]